VPLAVDGDPLEAITELDVIPGTDNEVLVANKTHTVAHYRITGDQLTLLGTFVVPGVNEASDCGLLSTAFDPDFANNHLVYFAFCESPMYSRITRSIFDPAAAYASIATTQTLVIRVGSDVAPKAWHNVGSIGFDPTGNLWALFGDKVIPARAQDPSEPLGSVIRIVPRRTDPAGGFDPAPGNPFLGTPNHDPSIVAYGIRSPWRGTLDDHGRLWLGDVGDSSFEEIDVSRLRGENFGSGVVEGPCDAATIACAGLTDPIASWDRSLEHRYAREDPDAVQTQRRIVWVGANYPRATPIDRYSGLMFDRILVGDMAGGWVRALGLDANDQLVYDRHVGHLEAVSSWAVGTDGYLYAATYGSALAFPYLPGTIYRAIAR